MTSERTGKSEQMYKDLGSFVFKETAKALKKPTTLILKLKGLGSWHLRRRRMQIILGEWDERAKVKTREEFNSDVTFNLYLERHALVKIFEDRLKDYERYLSIKKEIREKRYETQTLLKPIDGSDERFKSS